MLDFSPAFFRPGWTDSNAYSSPQFVSVALTTERCDTWQRYQLLLRERRIMGYDGLWREPSFQGISEGGTLRNPQSKITPNNLGPGTLPAVYLRGCCIFSEAKYW